MNYPWKAKANPMLAPLATPLPYSAMSEPLEPEQVKPIWMVVAAMITVAAWQLPFGNYLTYPFTILATWSHEMGHGLTALLMGGQFENLRIFPDGSGVAYHSAPAGDFVWGRLKEALVAAGGPMGPPLAGAAFILASRRFKTAHYGLLLLGSLMLLSTLIWVRSLFGFIFIPLLGLVILLIGLRAPRGAQAFALQFLGVQACISTFEQVNYLFTAEGVIGGQLMPSDSSQIARNLLLPYWFWGGLMALGSVILLVGSLYLAYRPNRALPQAAATSSQVAT